MSTNDNEFIAARLARVAKAAGVDMPAGDNDFIAGTAGSILGTIARKLEVQSGAWGAALLSQQDRVRIEMAAMAFDDAAKRHAKKGRPVQEHTQRCHAARLRAIAERIQQRAPTAAAQPEQASGMVLAPHFRGYAHLGIGAYVLNHSAAGEVPELSISVATEAQKAGRAVGDLRDNEPGELVQAKDIAVRLRFDNAAGLDALEQQLDFVRTVHFPESLAQPTASTAATQPAQASEREQGDAVDYQIREIGEGEWISVSKERMQAAQDDPHWDYRVINTDRLERAERALRRAGFEDHGGEDWTTPLGQQPRATPPEPANKLHGFDRGDLASIKPWQERMDGKADYDRDDTPEEVAMQAEIDDLRAALAVPASTKPDGCATLPSVSEDTTAIEIIREAAVCPKCNQYPPSRTMRVLGWGIAIPIIPCGHGKDCPLGERSPK